MDDLMLFALLLSAHVAGDFWAQNDFIARFKARSSNAGFWWIVLFSHAYIHGSLAMLAVLVWMDGSASKMLLLASLAYVTVTHLLIDFAKCEGCFGAGTLAFVTDQTLHLVVVALTTVCVLAWVSA